MFSVFDWLVDCESMSDGTSLVSFLELFIGWRMATGHHVPVEDPITRKWVDPDHLLVEYFRGTLAHRMSIFRRVCCGIFEELGLGVQRGDVLLTHSHVMKKMSGVLLCWPSKLAAKVDAFMYSPEVSSIPASY